MPAVDRPLVMEDDAQEEFPTPVTSGANQRSATGSRAQTASSVRSASSELPENVAVNVDVKREPTHATEEGEEDAPENKESAPSAEEALSPVRSSDLFRSMIPDLKQHSLTDRHVRIVEEAPSTTLHRADPGYTMHPGVLQGLHRRGVRRTRSESGGTSMGNVEQVCRLGLSRCYSCSTQFTLLLHGHS